MKKGEILGRHVRYDICPLTDSHQASNTPNNQAIINYLGGYRFRPGLEAKPLSA